MNMFNLADFIHIIKNKADQAKDELLSGIDTIQINEKPSPINRKRYNTPSSRNNYKINDNSRSLSRQTHQQLSPSLNPQKILGQRKKQLLQQLRTIDNQLRRYQLQKSRTVVKRAQINQTQMHQRASDLVQRMNVQRYQLDSKRRKKNQSLNCNVKKSLKYYEALNQMKQEEKLSKRKQIQDRIQNRKMKQLERKKNNKISNQLIEEISNYNTSLPIINKIHQSAQHHEIKIFNHQKLYPRSQFLENIAKEQLLQKKEAFNKSYQKKKIRQRQQQYGQKIRGNKKDNHSVFVT